MKEVDNTIDCLSSCPVYVELDMLEDAAIALGSREAIAVLSYSDVTLGGVVKAAAYVTNCLLVFWLVCIGLGVLILMVFPDLRFIRQV